MTYCLGLRLNGGIVALADTRTNAGVDNVSTFGKLRTWFGPATQTAPARAVAIMSSGNLSVTQEVMNLIDEEIAANGAGQTNGLTTLMTAPSMFRVAERVGSIMTDVQGRRAPTLGLNASASLLVAGQIGAEAPGMYLVYPEGNAIEATLDTPFLQIGEIKYGKPILDRLAHAQMSLDDGVKLAALSMAGTLRSNLSVGMPLDLAVLPAGSHQWRQRRVEIGDADFTQLADAWDVKLRTAFAETPGVSV